MNYIKLINAFWQLRRRREDFDPFVIALYFALVSKANQAEWKPFKIYREDIIQLAGMAPSTYYKARKILKEAGAIDFEEGASKLSQCSYLIIQLYATRTEGDTEDDTVGDTVGSTEGDTEDSTIYINLKTSKPLNFKTKKGEAPTQEPLKAKTKKGSGQESAKASNAKVAAGGGPEIEIVYPFDTPTFKAAWQKWLDHKQRMKSPYKSKTSEQMALMRLSEFDEPFSTQLIENSIDREWEGLIYSRTKGDYQNYLSQKTNGKPSFKINASAGRSADFGGFRDLVRDFSANPRGDGDGSAKGPDATRQASDGAYHGEGQWRYPGK